MLSFLFTVLMLTALFSATAGLAFAFRKSALKGRESGMYCVWLAVIVLALIPIKVGEPRFVLFTEEQEQISTAAAAGTPKLSELLKYNNSMSDFYTEGDIQKYGENPEKTAPETASAPINSAARKDGLDTFGILKSIGEKKDIFAKWLLILWFSGFIFVTARTVYGYLKMKNLFYMESDICADERINGIFEECQKITGLKKAVGLRVVNWNYTSPCVCGLLKPAVFIDGGCFDLSDEKLKYIFVHELYHVKRYDMLYKCLSVIAAGVHWFNPLTYKVLRTIGEDCEFSVDRQVMNIFGNGQSDCYMNVILDIAERKCSAKNNRQLVKIPSASLFFGEHKNIDFLKRRYANMKNITNKKRLIVALSIFLAAIISINIAVISSCGIAGTATAANLAGQSPVIKSYEDVNVYEAALRLYFGLLPGEEITRAQLEEITDIAIVRGIKADGLMTESIGNLPLGGLTPVSFIINGREFDLVPALVHKRVFNGFVQDKIAALSSQRTLDKLNAYYTVEDPSDPSLTPEALEEMRLTCPIAFEFPVAVFDPNASNREYVHILGFFAEAGLLDDSFAQNGAIDAGYLTNLPNLRNAAFYNIAAKNLGLLTGVNTKAEESEYVYIDEEGRVFVGGTEYSAFPVTEESAVFTDQSLSGIYEHPNYGINVTETDYFEVPAGTVYLEFKNESLRAAIAEYFAVNDDYPEYFDFIPWSPVTLEMLNKITSISVRRIPEYDFVYDNSKNHEIPLDGMYIEYTINGKTLDIVPKFIRIDVADFVSDYIDNEHGLLYYSPKAGLSKEDKLELYTKIAEFGFMRLAVYKDDGSGYFTVGRPDLLGFTARYYDKPEFDASDIAYMRNLTEFSVDGMPEKK